MNDFFSQLKILISLWGVIQKKEPGFGRKTVAEFETKLARFLGAKHVVSVGSGTDALILSLKAFGIGPGDEVIVPAVSAFATAAAVRWINAVPIFVDVRMGDLLMDPEKIEKVITPKTRAIIPVHLSGKIADLERILQIAKQKSLIVIEDAAQAIGAKYKNHGIGYWGDAACLSFNPQKILSAWGDGGAVVTNNSDIAEKIIMMRMYGTKPDKIHREHPMVGITSRLSPLHATILTLKLSELETVVAVCRKNYFCYSELLRGMGDLGFLEISSAEHFINGYRFLILTSVRDKLYRFMKDRGVAVRIDHFVPLPYFDVLSSGQYQPGDFPIAEKIAETGIFLPTHPPISEKEIIITSKLIKQYFA